MDHAITTGMALWVILAIGGLLLAGVILVVIGNIITDMWKH